jgi:hypothetical protein
MFHNKEEIQMSSLNKARINIKEKQKHETLYVFC